MKWILLTCLIFSRFTRINAQTVNIRGEIVNEKNELPIGDATVLLYTLPDSSVERTEVSDNEGLFQFENMRPGNYFLEISSVGFSELRSDTIMLSGGKDLDLGKMVLRESPKTLEGVVITARKPLIERKADKLVYNVGSSISASTSSALELLEKAPGVNVDKDGNISLRGKSGVIILIDDRPTYMTNSELTDYLKSLPASSLDQLEIMTNPSARYDAAGNSGIINIKTKKMKRYGMNGSVNSSLRYTDRLSGSSNLNFNYRNGKINIFGNYNYTDNNDKSHQNILRYFKNSDTKNIVSTFDQSNIQYNSYKSNNLKLGVDYYAGKNTIAGIVLSGNHQNTRDDLTGNSWFSDAGGRRDSGLTASNIIFSRKNSFSANANLRHNFDSAGRKMTADLDFISYDKPQTTALSTNYLLPDGSVQKPSALLYGNIPSKIKIYSGKIDFTIPFKKWGQLETGLKASRVETDNNAQYENKINGKYETDYGKSNHFIYEESIYAAYVSWSKQLKKWGLQAGVRAENTQSTGHQLGNSHVPDSSFTKSYLNIFPTAYISYKADDNNTFGLDFGRRVRRPDYADLNPFLYFLDEYTYEAGNVYLQPQFTNRIEISHSFKSLIHSSVSYSHTSDGIYQVIRQDPEKKIIYATKANIATESGITFSTGVNLRTGRMFSTNADFTIGHEQYEGQLGMGFLRTSGWMHMAKISEGATFGKGWSAELSGLYVSPQVYGQILTRRFWRADASLQKKILKEKGSIGFSVRDIFDSQKFGAIINSDNLKVLTNYIPVGPSFSISFRYSFGKPIKGLKNYRSGSASDEEGRTGAR